MYFYHETNMKYVSYRLREINDFDFDFEVWRLPLLTGVERPGENYEVVAGTGEHCVPGAGADTSCGDGGPALQARLIFPKVHKTTTVQKERHV
jgi:hypothetical protein